ncbi:LPXTG cell wall anchor domain-containing protein [Subtercola boreus]|uniref:LPXTG cell wall anchor domain-containing protein n=1 Tax=Subtercola boreus TaxID=120213 RepID=UPI001558CA86|nr:LPXTG cell wall anchor domain-containing protein [Subtercola boreus]
MTGSGDPGASVAVVIGDTTLTTTVGADGTWSVTFADVQIGSYTATATQTVGVDSTSAATTFAIVASTSSTSSTTSTGSGTSGYSGYGSGYTSSGGSLAHTGLGDLWLGPLAAVVLLAGSGLLLIRRKRRSHTEH